MFEAEFRALVKSLLEIETVDWGVNEEGVKFPAALMYMATQIRDHTLDGGVSLKKSIVRVDIWTDDISLSQDLAYKLEPLDGYRGTEDSKISVIHLDSKKEKSHTAQDFITHSVSLDFFVWHY